MVDLNNLQTWSDFVRIFNLTEQMQSQFKTYFNLFQYWSDMHNLTAIKDDEEIINRHFMDSLYLSKFIDLNKYESLCDVGSGGGFPGLPLKIMYPHLNLYLNEVNQKKVAFLETVIEELGLQNASVIETDFRNFIRSGEFDIDIFTARASLSVDELIRIFKPSSKYKDSDLVYWGSYSWPATPKEKIYVKKEFEYQIGDVVRKFYLLNDK